MRLWSLHPKYLDSKGLVAVWREALLAQVVLRGQTRGYRHHPLLERFRTHAAPLSAIHAYLAALCAEAETRGYSFDKTKIGPRRTRLLMPVSSGQLHDEWAHLLAKLRSREPALHRQWRPITARQAQPLFHVRHGNIAPWERLTKSSGRLGAARMRHASKWLASTSAFGRCVLRLYVS